MSINKLLVCILTTAVILTAPNAKAEYKPKYDTIAHKILIMESDVFTGPQNYKILDKINKGICPKLAFVLGSLSYS